MIISLNYILEGLTNIESIFSDKDKAKLLDENTRKPKSVLLRKIQESLASNNKLQLESKTVTKMKKMTQNLNEYIAN